MPELLVGNFVVNKYVIATGILVFTVILSMLIKKILVKIAHMTSKTETKLDDIILEYIKTPARLIIFTVGFFLAIEYIYPDLTFREISIEQIFSIVWVLAVALLVNKIVNALFEWYAEELQHKLHRKIDNTVFQFTKRVVNVLIYLLALMIILSHLGIEITPLLAGLGIGGLAIALALKDTLANFFGALFITVDRPMKIGDFIELDDKTAGYVQDIGWRTTRIRTWDNNHLIIPNSKIADALMRNYSAPKTSMKIKVNCGVAYDSDLEKVEKVALDVAKKVLKEEEGGVEDFGPSLRFYEFGNSSINFSVVLEVKDKSYKFPVRHAFIKELHKRFKKEKIEIPFPQRDVRMRK